MKKIILLLAFVFIVQLQSSFAHGPKDIEIDYNEETKTLNVVVHHITQIAKKHYIRKMVIIKNDEEPINRFFYRQYNRLKVIKNVPLEAKDGDVIKIIVYGNKGGEYKWEFTLGEEKD